MISRLARRGSRRTGIDKATEGEKEPRRETGANLAGSSQTEPEKARRRRRSREAPLSTGAGK